MLKRSHIRQFLALVDTGSFTQAAQRIRVTQPTLSAGIADLERLVENELFIRDRRGVRLTDRGGAFLPIARDLEHRFGMADSFGKTPADERRVLRLGTIRTIAGPTLQKIITWFAQAFDMELTEGSDYELRTAMAASRLDLALTILRADEGGDAIWPVIKEPYMMLAPANHRFVGNGHVRPDELASEVMIARRACEALNETSRFFTRSGVRPRFAFKSDNDERCMRMVAAGLGITTAPLSLAIEGVRPINVEGYNLTRRVGLIINLKVAAGKSVNDFVAETLEDVGFARLPAEKLSSLGYDL